MLRRWNFTIYEIIVVAEDLFDLAVSSEEKNFIKKGLLLECEVASEILTELEKFPWLGSLIKLGRIGSNFIDLHFVYKIAKFLQQSEDIPEDKKEKFLQNLDAKQRKKMYEYLIHFLYLAESDEKAVIMGYVYRERIIGNIDDSLFLRLCSIINKLYLEDLKHLGTYLEPSNDTGYITDNLISYGLLKNPGASFKGTTLDLNVKHTLNDVGTVLYKILKSANWLK